MTTTAPSRASVTEGRGRLPAPVRDRRPALAALSLLLVLGGALTSALIAYRSGDRVDVLVARVPIAVGQTVKLSDFGIARVAPDDDASVIEKAAEANFDGASATTNIPVGTLLNRNMFLAGTSVVPPGAAVVGVVLSTGQRPAVDLRAGDVVRVFLVPRDAGSGVIGTVLAEAVLVAEAPLGIGGGDSARLSLLVPVDLAAEIVTAAATGSLAVTRLAPDVKPAVSFRTG